MVREHPAYETRVDGVVRETVPGADADFIAVLAKRLARGWRPVTSYRAQPSPKRMSVDILRDRTWIALKAAQPQKTGSMPAVDHVFQAVYLLSCAGLGTSAVAEALGVSQNYVRVAKRNNAKKLLPEPPADAKPRRSSKTETETRTPDLTIEEIFTLTRQLQRASNDDAVARHTVAELRKIERPDPVEQRLAFEARQDRDTSER